MIPPSPRPGDETTVSIGAQLPTPAHAQTRGIDRAILTKALARLEFLYAEVAKAWPGFVARPSQHQMMHAALLTFLSARRPDDDASSQGSNLALLEAGTGTGKTVAYCLAAIVASELLKRTVVVSTATVALQEQLVHKDLPRLAEIIPGLRFDILKGRGRYVCESRLDAALNERAQQSLPGDEYQPAFAEFGRQSQAVPRDSAQALRWFASVAKKLRTNHWDGDIDDLEPPPDPQDWRQVQANAQACNAGQCEHFKSCAFFKARRRAASATLQVANHALILATLQTDSALIDPAETLFVFDEAHHLPGIATDQFSHRARLGASVSLLASLRALVNRHGREMPASARPDPVAFGQTIGACSDRLTVFETCAAESNWVSADRPVHRFAQGRIPEALVLECEQLRIIIRSIAGVVAGVAAALIEPDESKSPAERDERTRAGVEMGAHLARLDTLERLFDAWATHSAVPWAKWVEHSPAMAGMPKAPGAGAADMWLCASPMTAAQLLSRGLWKNVSAAVCTSATLTACGNFDFFERLSGMNRFPERRALVVESPFDYATQGELRIAAMTHSPKSPGFSEELCQTLPALLREHRHGQLVLFTSRRQMQACHAALPGDLKEVTQMQGERSRTELLREHGRRIARGRPSILFGLQSFGEGIDLPGRLCEHVLIDKLPFAPPDSPVEEALAEWLTAQGRDPFTEIAVPRAAMKLAQWTGRGVRTITDRAVITVCDTRLVTLRYGRDILAGLPPYPVRRSLAAVAAPAVTG